MNMLNQRSANNKAVEGITPHLNDPSLIREAAYIGGAWVEGDDSIAVINPATQEVIGNALALRQNKYLQR